MSVLHAIILIPKVICFWVSKVYTFLDQQLHVIHLPDITNKEIIGGRADSGLFYLEVYVRTQCMFPIWSGFEDNTCVYPYTREAR